MKAKDEQRIKEIKSRYKDELDNQKALIAQKNKDNIEYDKQLSLNMLAH